MPGYQKSLGRHAVLVPGETVFVAYAEEETTATGKALVGPRAQRIGAAEHRRLWVGVRTRTLRKLIRRVCLSETNAVSAASYAARPRVGGAQGTLSFAKGKPLRCARGPTKALQALTATQANRRRC